MSIDEQLLHKNFVTMIVDAFSNHRTVLIGILAMDNTPLEYYQLISISCKYDETAHMKKIIELELMKPIGQYGVYVKSRKILNITEAIDMYTKRKLKVYSQQLIAHTCDNFLCSTIQQENPQL